MCQVINKLLNDQELEKSPRIIMNGDFNLPFMDNWNEDVITDLLDLHSKRSEQGKSIASDKVQAKAIYDFVNRNVMEQYINEPTFQK